MGKLLYKETIMFDTLVEEFGLNVSDVYADYNGTYVISKFYGRFYIADKRWTLRRFNGSISEARELVGKLIKRLKEIQNKKRLDSISNDF